MNVYIPEQLPQIFHTLQYPEYICLLCDLIYTNITYDDNGEPYPYSQIHSSVLRKKLGCRRAKLVIQEAVNNNIVKVRDVGKKGAYYVAGFQCKLYQLGAPYILQNMIQYEITKTVEPKPAPPYKHNLRGIYLQLFHMLKHLEISNLSNEEVRAIINSRKEFVARGKIKNKNLQYRKLRLEIDKIRNKNFYGEKGENNKRFYSNITNIRKEARHFMTSRGKRLYEIDMKCSQPHDFYNFLLVKQEQIINMNAIQKKCFIQYVVQWQKRCQNPGKNNIFFDEETIFLHFTGDLEAFYQKELKNSQLYDNIAAYMGCSRDEAKIELLRYFFGKHFSKRFPVNDYFNANYPILHIVVGYIKRNKHSILAQVLQEYESNIFIHTIAARILTEYPHIIFYTIHDSIVCEEGDDIHIIEKIVKEELSKVFLNPTVKGHLL